MYQSNDSHREAIVKEIGEYINNKYQKGQKAHGGHLWRKNLTPHAIEEAADLCVYLFTKREQEDALVKRLDKTIAFMHSDWHNAAFQEIKEIKNILTIGNPEGIEEVEHEQ